MNPEDIAKFIDDPKEVLAEQIGDPLADQIIMGLDDLFGGPSHADWYVGDIEIGRPHVSGGQLIIPFDRDPHTGEFIRQIVFTPSVQ